MTTAPAFEFKDGYPTEESLKVWEDMEPNHVTPHDAARFLVDMPSMKPGLACASINVRDVFEEPAKVIYFATGGWSGAEDIIDAILSQFWVRHFHSKWERGGAYWFEVPTHFLQPER